jgi:hypothetical protein
MHKKKDPSIKTNLEIVKGHQDNPTGNRQTPIEKLLFAAQLNCHADFLATTQHTCQQCGGGTLFHPPPKVSAFISVAGNIITSHLPKVILSTCRRTALQDLILKQTGWDPPMFDWVDWHPASTCAPGGLV